MTFIQGLTEKGGKAIPVYVDPAGLEEAEKTMTSPVKLALNGVPLRTSLRLLLKQLGLAYCVHEGLLYISTPKNVLDELERPRRTTRSAEAAWAVAWAAWAAKA